MHAERPNDFLSVEEIASICGLDATYSKDEKLVRAYVHKMRKMIRDAGFIVHNKRNVGWKIAIGFEALDEREKICNKTLKYIISVQRTHLNKTLTISDIFTDNERKEQHFAIKEFAENLSAMILTLDESLDKSPMRKKAVKDIDDSLLTK